MRATAVLARTPLARRLGTAVLARTSLAHRFRTADSARYPDVVGVGKFGPLKFLAEHGVVPTIMRECHNPQKVTSPIQLPPQNHFDPLRDFYLISGTIIFATVSGHM